MLLYFLRHGEAGMHYATDAERELTDRGIESIRSVGQFIAARNIRITHILCSPLLRARQSADALLHHLPPLSLMETEFLVPESDPKNLLQHLRSFPSDGGVLCVTHEPLVSTCISTLISGNESANISMRTAAFACVESNGYPSRGNGRLLWLLPPDILSNTIPA